MAYSICPNCFSDIDSTVCPYCGYDQANAKQYEDALGSTVLNARYLTGRVLGKGGFGITYLAKDLISGNMVAIKECLPESFSYRDSMDRITHKVENTEAFLNCKKNFDDEIRTLYDLRSNIFVVDVLDYFTENNTEYFVMEYVDGISLKVLVNSQNGITSIDNASSVMFTIGSALMEVHKKGYIHCDISPENIMISRNGDVKLIDFGAAKYYLSNTQDDSGAIFLKPGFAPPEQYNFEPNKGPWTDVYALAATFYTIVSGAPMIPADMRVDNDAVKPLVYMDCGVSQRLSDIVAKGLALDIHDRYSNVGDFLLDLAENLDGSTQFDTDTLSIIESHKRKEQQYGAFEDTSTPYVQILSGNSAGKQVKIPDSGFLKIGRSGAITDVTLDDFTDISRYHCLVGYDQSKNHFIIIDKSHNGTFFSNNQRMMLNGESYIAPDEYFYVCENGIKIKVMLVQGN